MTKEEIIELFKDTLEMNALNTEALGKTAKELGLENDQDVINWADRINAVSVSI